MSGLWVRKTRVSWRSARASSTGRTGRTSSGTRVRRFGTTVTSDSMEPSGPVVGPESRRTSRPGFWRKPRTEATVFSCAPPTINRVITCATRITGSMAGFLQLVEPVGHHFVFLRAGRRVFQVGLVILYGGRVILLPVGDFSEAVKNAMLSWQRFQQRFVIMFCGVQLIDLQVGDGAVHQGDFISRLKLKDLVKGLESGLVGFCFDAQRPAIQQRLNIFWVFPQNSI